MHTHPPLKIHKHESGRQDGRVNALAQLVYFANCLAKQLTGPKRVLAYRIKAAAVSALVLDGAAKPNGIRGNAILSLDILADRPWRFHIPLSHLHPEAQAVLRKSLGSVRAKAPLFQFLDSDRLQDLQGSGSHTGRDGRVCGS